MSLSAAAGSPWSPQQRRWLQALGHAVYRHGDDGGQAQAPVPATDAVAASMRHGHDAGRNQAPDLRAHMQPAAVRDGAPRRAPSLDEAAPPVPVAAGAADAATDARAVPAGRRVPRLPDRLQLALLRASGLDPSDPAAQAAMAQWPVEQLRNDPAAKRAFWPQLRALRKRP